MDVQRGCRRIGAVVITAVVAVLATACYVPFDFTVDGKADRVWMDDDGVWHIEGLPDQWPSPVPPEDIVAMVAGNYDGAAPDITDEPAVVDVDGNWHTAGRAGTIAFPFPEGDLDLAIPVPADYDGDLNTEPAWWSIATATWYVHGQDPIVFGQAAGPDPFATSSRGYLQSDVPVPADYDADGDDDIATYNPVTNRWKVFGSDEVIQFGSPGGVPVPADWDGDGGADRAVFDVSSSTWTIEGLGMISTFGAGLAPLQLPAPADYTGDGLADPALIVGDSEPQAWHVEGLDPLAVDSWFAAPTRSAVLLNLVRFTFLDQCFEQGEGTCTDLLGVDHDYTGDGRADRVWIDQETGSWYLEGDPNPIWTAPTPTQQVPEQPPYWWPVPGDYDGDGVWEPAAVVEGVGWVTQTGFTYDFDALLGGEPYGPFHVVPADYDGDGTTDPAVYRVDQGIWRIEGMDPISFGQPSDDTTYRGDIAVPADYDGDGRDDLATYNPVTNEWKFHDGSPTIVYGEPGDAPVPADYDADGDDDIAVVDMGASDAFLDPPPFLTWQALDGPTASIQRLDGDIDLGPFPLPADYDGNGSVDFSYFNTYGFAPAPPGPSSWVTPGLPDLDVTAMDPAPMDVNLVIELVRLVYLGQCVHEVDCAGPL